MATTKGYLDFIMDQLAGLEGVRYRAMFGEYILYFQDRIVGGLYDDRLLVKPTASARAMLCDAAPEEPYPGAKPMLLVDRVEDREFLRALFEAMLPELPAPKPKKRKG